MTYIWDYYNIPYILTNIERYKMNAEKQTQVKSPTMQLIDHCQKQNELIFATRKRLFNLEHKQKTETLLFSGLIAIQFIMVVALVVSHG